MLEKAAHKDKAYLMLGYRGNVHEGDNCCYSRHKNISLSKFNVCYDSHYKDSIHSRRGNRSILLILGMTGDSAE